MNCDKCGNPAKVHLTQLVGGQVKKIALCNKCAKDSGVTDPTGFALAEMLLGGSGTSMPSLVPQAPKSGGVSCPDCGFTLEDLKKIRRFGCGTCYPTFREEVNQMIRGMHKGTVHCGKVPEGQVERMHRQRKLEDLQSQLEQAVNDENYEEAADLRDQIRKLETPATTE